jgi:hypothetical protein
VRGTWTQAFEESFTRTRSLLNDLLQRSWEEVMMAIVLTLITSRVFWFGSAGAFLLILLHIELYFSERLPAYYNWGMCDGSASLRLRIPMSRIVALLFRV